MAYSTYRPMTVPTATMSFLRGVHALTRCGPRGWIRLCILTAVPSRNTLLSERVRFRACGRRVSCEIRRSNIQIEAITTILIFVISGTMMW